MLKKETGITLTILIVTIVVMIILAGVIININTNLNKTTELKEIIANMDLIKAKAAPYSEEYVDDFSSLETDDESINLDDQKTEIVENLDLPGTHQGTSGTIIGTMLSQAGKVTLDDSKFYWFELDKDAVKELGVDIEQEDDEYYYINYKTLDIGYCVKESATNFSGITSKYSSKSDYYFYDQLVDLKSDEVGN